MWAKGGLKVSEEYYLSWVLKFWHFIKFCAQGECLTQLTLSHLVELIKLNWLNMWSEGSDFEQLGGEWGYWLR